LSLKENTRMQIKNTTYAKTPISTKHGVFTPDEHAALLISLAGFVSTARTPRVLAPLPEMAPVVTGDTEPPQQVDGLDSEAVLGHLASMERGDAEAPSAVAEDEDPVSTPADDLPVSVGRRVRGPKPK